MRTPTMPVAPAKPTQNETMTAARATGARFLRQQGGFTGAEKALLLTFALAIVALVGYLTQSGSDRAGGDARRTLSAGTGALGGGAGNMAGLTGGNGELPKAGDGVQAGDPNRAGNVAAQSGALTAPAAVQAPAAPAQPPLRSLPEGQADTAYDGAFVGADGRAYPANTPLDRIPPVRPSDGREPIGTMIYVNGIQTDKAAQSNSLQNIANTTGYQVIGIHNSTNGFFRDLAQCLGDKADVGTNPAVDTLADTLYDAVKAGRPIHVIAHSQGGLITSRALTHVMQRLRLEDGMSRAEAERAMSRIEVETFGAAAGQYPSGPQYVHYINTSDPVPTQFGLGSSPFGSLGSPIPPGLGLGPKPWGDLSAGRGARVIRFRDFHWNPIDSHSFDDVYLNHRVPFSQARGQNAPQARR